MKIAVDMMWNLRAATSPQGTSVQTPFLQWAPQTLPFCKAQLHRPILESQRLVGSLPQRRETEALLTEGRFLPRLPRRLL